jgi:hypothetical protein
MRIYYFSYVLSCFSSVTLIIFGELSSVSMVYMPGVHWVMCHVLNTNHGLYKIIRWLFCSWTLYSELGYYWNWNTSYFSITNIYSNFVQIHDCPYPLRNIPIACKKIYKFKINRIRNIAAVHTLATQFIFELGWRLLLDIIITNRPFAGPHLGYRYSNVVCRTRFPVIQPTYERYVQSRVFI